jgi:ring-1,2-phenylacetyl-CoA epoxidase subunit PaaB
MAYSVPRMDGDEDHQFDTEKAGWPMWEVFIRQRRGMSHVHCGSLHATDAETAVQNARDVYTRRQEGVSIWVVPSSVVTAFDPDDAEAYIEANAKPYRHATHYDIPEEVGHM